MLRVYLLRVCLLIVLLTGGTVYLQGQVTGGSIVGNVQDPSGTPIPDTAVRAINEATNQVDVTKTQSTGYYEFVLLPAGRYRVVVEREGFQRTASEAFPLSSGTRPRVDLTLALGTVNSAVQVSAQASLLNTTSTDLGRVIEGDKIESLPLNSRNFQELVGLQAGVVNAPSAGVGSRAGIEFNGSSALANNLLLDGVDMSFGEVNSTASDAAAGAGTGGAHVNVVSVEAIAEVKATGSAFSAEYGRAAGGVLTVTTKSGTNDLHGTLFEFFRNDALDANSFFSNLSGLAKPPLRWNQYGGNLGGPVRKNRIFFFFNYEGVRVKQSAQITGNVPTQALLDQLPIALTEEFTKTLPSAYAATSNPLVGLHRRNDMKTDDESTYMARVDGQFGAHRVSVRYNYNHQDVQIPNLRPKNPQLYPTRYHNAAIQDAWVISPAWFNELRIGLNRLDENRTYVDQNTTSKACIAISALSISEGCSSDIHYKDTTYTLADNLSNVRGRHTLKMGFEIRPVRAARWQGSTPIHTYTTAADAIADKAAQVRVQFGNPGRPLNHSDFGFYFQDDWRLSRRVQLNMGVRYEFFTPLKGRFNVQGSDPFGPYGTNADPNSASDLNNFGPRLGVVFDVFGNQKTVLRAGGAIAYSSPNTIHYFDGAFVHPLLPFAVNFAPSDLPAGVSSAFPFSQVFVQQVIADISLLPKGFISGRTVSDFDRADPYSGQWNFNIQQVLAKDLTLQVGYVGSRGVKLFAGREVNQNLPGAATRPRPEFSSVVFQEDAGRSVYHALQFSLNQRLRKGLAFDTYYTWSRNLGYYGVDGTFTSDGTIQDLNNIAGSTGPKQGVQRHRWVSVLSYQIPTLPAAKALRPVLGGWTLQTIATVTSGIPINVLSGLDLAKTGYPGPQRPDYVAGVDPYQRDRDGLTWLNAAAFSNTAAAAARRFGNLGYNALEGPGSFYLDAALHKAFSFHDHHRVTFRLEAFRALNHMNLGTPNVTLTSPMFGAITTGSAGRNVQLALKYAF